MLFGEGLDSLSVDDLTELFGDYYFRHECFGKALAQYKKIEVRNSIEGQLQPVTILSPVYKAIKCLCLIGRCEDAQRECDRIEKDWGNSVDELNRGFVEKSKSYLQAHCVHGN